MAYLIESTKNVLLKGHKAAFERTPFLFCGPFQSWKNWIMTSLLVA